MPHGKVDFIKENRSVKLIDNKKLSLAQHLKEVTANEAHSLAFMPKFLIITTLPHSDPESREYERSAQFGISKTTLTILSRFGVPYGLIPRRILAWVCAEAIKTKCPTIYLGKSQAEFLTNIGVRDDSVTLSNFKEQSKRLFSSAISVDLNTYEQKKGIQILEFEQVFIASKASFLWQPHKNSEDSAWECELTLSDDFFKSLMDKVIPIDMRIIAYLSSSLAIDIYVFLCWRLSYLKTKILLSWKELKNRLGSGYPDTAQGMAHFKEKVKKQLKEVLILQDNFKVEIAKEGLFISPSHLQISKKTTTF